MAGSLSESLSRLVRVKDQSSRPLAVFDLDGTLADTAHRQRFLERSPRDWEGFFAAASEDPPLAEGVALALSSARECEVVYLTGRPERCRRATVEWLAGHGLPEGRIWMRRNDDRRPDQGTRRVVAGGIYPHSACVMRPDAGGGDSCGDIASSPLKVWRANCAQASSCTV